MKTGISEFEERIVRVGGRSQSEKLKGKKINLNIFST